MSGSSNGLKLIDFSFEHPVFSARMAEQRLGCAYVTAANIIRHFVELDIVREITGMQRNRLFRYDPYVALFDRQMLAPPGPSGD